MANGSTSATQGVVDQGEGSAADALTQHLGVVLLGLAAVACVAGVVFVVLHRANGSSTAAIAAVSSLGSAAVGGIAGVLTAGGARRSAITQSPAASPAISTDRASGVPRSAFSVSGSGFAAGETITISLGPNALAPATADGSGSFSQTEAVPPVASGPFTITATGQSSGVTAQASFTVA